MKSLIRFSLAALAVLTINLLASSALAQPITWANPGTSGDASDPNSWDPVGTPTLTDAVVLPEGPTTYTVTLDLDNDAGRCTFDGLSIGDGVTVVVDPFPLRLSGPLEMTADAVIEWHNADNSIFQGTAASDVHPDSRIIHKSSAVHFFAPAYTGGTLVIDRDPALPNPTYPISPSTVLAGDLIVQRGTIAMSWGAAANFTCRNLIATGEDTEVRLRNGNADGVLTITNDLTVTDGALFRDAAGALVVDQDVDVRIGGNVTISDNGIIRHQGGAFDWNMIFEGAGNKTWTRDGANTNQVEHLIVEEGAILTIEGGAMAVVGNVTAGIADASTGPGDFLDPLEQPIDPANIIEDESRNDMGTLLVEQYNLYVTGQILVGEDGYFDAASRVDSWHLFAD